MSKWHHSQPNADRANRRPSQGTGRGWIPLALFLVGVVVIALVGAPPLDASVAAQTSPLSPLVVSGSDAADSIPLQALTFNPLASGHAGLWRALLVLAVVVGAAVVMVWRQA